LDVAAYNAFILHKLKFPLFYKNKINRERAYGLETLCYELHIPNNKARDEKFADKNYHRVHSSLFASIKNNEFFINLFII